MKTEEGLWKLSPSGLYGYTECRPCFWIEQHFGRAPSLPFVLNMAMDSILKSRYDKYRKNGHLPPEVAELEKQGIRPFEDLGQLNEWRGSVQHLEVKNEKEGYVLRGMIDELLLEPDGRFIASDYKSSGYMPKEDKKKYYILQLNAYALMFREHGHKVSDRGFLLHYFIKNTKSPSLEVEFNSHVDEIKIDLANLEKVLKDIVKTLNDPYPGDNNICQKCQYYQGREQSKDN